MLEDMYSRLAEPFDVEQVEWRAGSTNVGRDGEPPQGKQAQGLALAYIDARDVMDRLDLVCGPDGWQNRYPHANGKTVCEIGVRCEGEWIWKSDGAGDTDVEAEKGALSDAFKRAAVRWGIGRYLYGLPSPWVDLEKKGRSWVIKKDQYAKLRQILRQHTGISAKSAAQAQRDKDYDYFVGKIAAASNMEELGAVGREIKDALPRLPAAMRDPLHDAYAIRRDEIMEAPDEFAGRVQEAFPGAKIVNGKGAERANNPPAVA